jgi:hypothetical protein
MNITSATKYVDPLDNSVHYMCEIDGKMTSFQAGAGNVHYDTLMQMEADGDIVIAEGVVSTEE